MQKRDIDADYKAAYIHEYEAYRRAGRSGEAERVAKILREQYGHEVDPKPSKKVAPERADTKAPENAAAPKPSRKN